MNAKTLFACIALLGLAIFYWISSIFVAFGGPVDDVVCLTFVVPVILLHALSFGRAGLVRYLPSALVLGSVLTLLLSARFFEILNRHGHSFGHAARSLHALFWSFVWIAAAATFVSWRHRRHLRSSGQLPPSEDTATSSSRYDY